MWYSSGTVSVTSGGTTVTGSGTAFLANVRIGDGITIQGSTALHEVIGIASNTSLTIRPEYAGTTGSGRQYATVPVLGYDKDLSDAFNDIRLNFGSTLSALQPWAYAATAEAARAGLGLGSASQRDMPAGVNELGTIVGLDVPPGVNEVYHRLNAVGTVSESGGVPTGAIIEQGVNSNGRFSRYAGGLQVCWHTHTASLAWEAYGTGTGLYKTAPALWVYPASFVGVPAVSCMVDPDIVEMLVVLNADTEAAVSYRAVGPPNPGGTMNKTFHSIAIGRWF